MTLKYQSRSCESIPSGLPGVCPTQDDTRKAELIADYHRYQSKRNRLAWEARGVLYVLLGIWLAAYCYFGAYIQ